MAGGDGREKPAGRPGGLEPPSRGGRGSATARAEGRQVALVSAADHRQVTAIAEATGLFDEAYGSAEGTNLKGAEKARFLTQHYGEKGFDYVGDSRADVPVWGAARQAITVGADAGLRRAAEAANSEVTHIAPPEGRAKAMLRAMRPHQWSKNLLLFLPLLAAHDVSALSAVVLAFAAFCLTASAVYVLNDLVDLEADRAHPRKRKRPFAAGDLTAAEGLLREVVAADPEWADAHWWLGRVLDWQDREESHGEFRTAAELDQHLIDWAAHPDTTPIGYLLSLEGADRSLLILPHHPMPHQGRYPPLWHRFLRV